MSQFIKALITATAFTLVSVTAQADLGTTYDNIKLHAKVNSALVTNKEVQIGNLDVEVSRGIVQISGFVDDQAEKTATITTAKQVEGVKEVLDALVILDGDRSAGDITSDTSISTKLKTRLASVEGIGAANDIKTEVKFGHVLLAGFVDSQSIKDSAGAIAKGIEGVKEVYNLIAITPAVEKEE